MRKQISKERTLVCEALLCCHIEKEVIKIQYLTSSMIDLHAYQTRWTSCERWMCSNHLYTSICSKFVCALSTIFTFMVTYMYMYVLLGAID